MIHALTEGHFTASDDPLRLDMDVIHGFLSRVYWSVGVPREIIERAVRNSLSFGVYDNETRAQVGFGRVVTDRATYAYLADVFILESHRGRGLSKLLMRCITTHPELQDLRRWMLMTRDAHALYTQFGFTPLVDHTRAMERIEPRVYDRINLTAATKETP